MSPRLFVSFVIVSSVEVACAPVGVAVIVGLMFKWYAWPCDWLGEPRLRLDGERIPRPRGVAFDRASQDAAAQRFLVWSRYPAIALEPDRGAIRVTFTDVRYPLGQLEGPKVYLPASVVESGGD